jgi:hypothetical protein
MEENRMKEKGSTRSLILCQILILLILLGCNTITNWLPASKPNNGDGEGLRILPFPETEQYRFEKENLREKLAQSLSSYFEISSSFRELDFVNFIGGSFNFRAYQYEDLLFFSYNQRILVFQISGETITFLSATQLLPIGVGEMWISNNHLYAFNSKYNGYVVLDISEINNIEILNFVEDDSDGSINIHAQVGNMLYGAMGGDLIVINESKSNRLESKKISINDFSENDFNVKEIVQVYEEYILIFATSSDYFESYVQVLDFSDPENISLLVSIPSADGFSPYDAIMIGTDVIVFQDETNGPGGALEFWDLSNYLEPALTKKIEIDPRDFRYLVKLSNHAFAVTEFSETANTEQMIFWVKENGNYDVQNRIKGVDITGIFDERNGVGDFGIGPYKYGNYLFWLESPRVEPSYFSYHVFNMANPIFPEYIKTESVSQSLAQFDNRSQVLKHFYEEIRQGNFVPVEYDSDLLYHDELPYIFPELDIHQTLEIKQWDQYLLLLGLIGDEGDLSKLGRHNIDVFILMDVSDPGAPKILGNPIAPHQHSLSTTGLSYSDSSTFAIVNNFLIHLDATAWCEGEVPDICQPEYHIYNISKNAGLEYLLTLQASPRIFWSDLMVQSTNQYTIFSDQNTFEILRIDEKGNPESISFFDSLMGGTDTYSDQLFIKTFSSPGNLNDTNTYNFVFDRDHDNAYVGTMLYQYDEHELVEDILQKNILYTILHIPDCELCLVAIDINNPDELTLLGYYNLPSGRKGRITIDNELLIIETNDELLFFNLIDS